MSTIYEMVKTLYTLEMPCNGLNIVPRGKDKACVQKKAVPPAPKPLEWAGKTGGTA